MNETTKAINVSNKLPLQPNTPKVLREGRHRAVDLPKRKRRRRYEPTLTRTKGLLLAALRVWELKNGFSGEREFNAYPPEGYEEGIYL